MSQKKERKENERAQAREDRLRKEMMANAKRKPPLSAVIGVVATVVVCVAVVVVVTLLVGAQQ